MKTVWVHFDVHQSRLDAFYDLDTAYHSVKFSWRNVRGVTVEQVGNPQDSEVSFIVRNELGDEIGRCLFKECTIHLVVCHL